MVRPSSDKSTGGNKRKNGSNEEEEGLKKKACGWDRWVTSEPEEEEEEEEVVEEPEEAGDEVRDSDKMEETGEDGSDDDTEFRFTIDPDVLDCSICFEPLSPPIYQCRNGHIACSNCSSKLQNKCHVCSQPIGRRRCIALERVIESMTCPCKYANFGCKDVLLFAEKAAHEKCCGCAALFCPINSCIFSGSRTLLFAHAKEKHSDISMNFSYNLSFMIAMEKQQPFMILLAEDGHVFLLRNSRENCTGNMLSVICMASSRPEKEEFSYEFRAEAGGSSLQLRTSVEKMRNGVHPSKAFLVVPDGLFASSPEMFIIVCIYKSATVV